MSGRGASGTYNPSYRRERHLRRRYGITEEGYRALYEAQEGCCAICGEHKDVLHVDHDHATGTIRGLLCFGCNNGLGSFKDDVRRIVAAADYLLREQAAAQQRFDL